VSNGSDSSRLDRVENDITTIRTEMGGIVRDVGGLKSDVRGLGAVLTRIEDSISKAQERHDDREDRARPSLVAVVSVLITVISMLIGGAWLIAGQLGRQDERSVWQQRQMDRVEHRVWLHQNDRGGDRSGYATKA
jgi:hypothetical protein